MNIIGISNLSFVNPFVGHSQEQEQEAANPRSAGDVTGDVVDVRRPTRLLEDGEWEGVLAESVGMILGNPQEALQVHSGLDASRVAALLAW